LPIWYEFQFAATRFYLPLPSYHDGYKNGVTIRIYTPDHINSAAAYLGSLPKTNEGRIQRILWSPALSGIHILGQKKGIHKRWPVSGWYPSQLDPIAWADGGVDRKGIGVLN